MTPITLHAPAKLNLTLEVLGRRRNGLHGLRSVMVPVDLFDELVIYGKPRRFTVDPPNLERDNIVAQALQALGLEVDAIGVSLRKHIPVGGGMGGGSSDAAALLLAARRGMLPGSRSFDDLAAARALGSDVPFFLVETAALVEQTGERVTALGRPPQWHAIIVKPPVCVSTAGAYAQIDTQRPRVRPRKTSPSLAMAEALQRAQFDRVVALLENDFAGGAFATYPEIAFAAHRLRAAGATHAALTGSGSCVFSLAADTRDQQRILQRLDLPDGYTALTCTFWSGEGWMT